MANVAQRISQMANLSLDLLHNSIWSLKLFFLAPLSANFPAVCLHMPSKFVDKFAQKSPIFSTKASYARGLMLKSAL